MNASRRLWVTEVGPEGGAVVVLVHGSMDRASGMRGVARRLEDEFRVVLYDRRGYGRSRSVGGPYGIATQVDDLVEVLQGRPAVVFGHSLGGDIALAAAGRPDLVRAVGAYEPPMPWEPWWPTGTAGGEVVRLAEVGGPEATAAAASMFMRRMIGDARWERLPQSTRADREAEGAALVGELADLRKRPPFDPDRITVPVLLAYGERGARHHHDGARVLAERFEVGGPQPRAELVEVPGAEHGIHFQQPAAFADLVRRLVAMAAVTEP
ncbi:MAG TPA: alpha/beta hydrolase [Acidimicrobiales bacterium]|nr:alpha/beta hydrolase [Acidimicrobiales bacterium]